MNDTEVLYIDVDVWDKQSEFVQKFVKKGNSVSTQGRLKSREWTDEKGTKRTSFSVVADRINFFGGKKKDDADKQHDENPVSSVNDPSKAKKAVVVSGEDKEPMDDIQF
jgi:single-strand DNA-binding protein